MSYQQVTAQFDKANSFATNAASTAATFVEALQSTVTGLQMPQIELSVDWPTAPSFAGNVTVTTDSVATDFPADDSGSAPDAPTITLDPGDMPVAPALGVYTYTPSSMPEKPADLGALVDPSMPAEPETWTPPTAPTMLSVAVRAFGGIDSHTEWLTKLDTAPSDLAIIAPSAYVAPAVDRYDSTLLQTVKDALRARLVQSTGIAPEVEQAMWDRARSREAAALQTAVDEVTQNAEARGFALPSGAFAAQLREAQRTQTNKVLEASREIAFKQADLEQANAKHALEQGIALESRLVDYVNSIEARTFESARFLASNAVEVYNAQVTAYRASLERYTTLATVYRTLIEAETAKVTAYQAEVEAEKAKTEVNKALIDQMRAQIEVRNAQVALYRTQLDAVQAVVTTQRAKVEAFGERIKAYVAQINGEVARTEVFKAQLQSNQSIADTYRSSVDAFASRVNALGTLANSKANVFEAQTRSYSTKVQAYSARVQAAAEKVRANVSASQLKLEGAKAMIEQNRSNNQTLTEYYRALVGLYETNKNLGMQKAKIISDNYFALRNLVADASKVAAQVNAQLAASAYGTIHAGATVSGADSTATSFSYSGDTSDTRSAPTY